MMKIKLLILALFAGAFMAQAQTADSADCSCASCLAAKEGSTTTLPFLQELENEAVHEQDQDHRMDEQAAMLDSLAGHEGHDQVEQEGVAHDDHEGHDHEAEEGAALDEHTGHDEGAEEEGGVELSADVMKKVGIEVREAEGGIVARTSVFPAEIKLNRDRAASVSPRYPSVIRQVFAEIGDEVKKGDVLASLENRETLSVYSLAAPLDGVIISKKLAFGETADANDVLYEVADLSSVWADISIFPQYQHLIRKGSAVTFVAHDGHTTQGTVKYISPIISHETRTFTARCVLEGADEDFTPGAFVRARMVIEQVGARVVVPREAVQVIEGEAVVFTPGDHGFVATRVQTGLADDAGIEIREGLMPNDRYVARGAFALKAQMMISGMDSHAGHGH